MEIEIPWDPSVSSKSEEYAVLAKELYVCAGVEIRLSLLSGL